MNVSWGTATDACGVVGYKIYLNGIYAKSITTGLSTTVTGFTLDRQCYTISAYDAANNESSQSAQQCANPFAPLPDTGQTGDYSTTFGEDSDYSFHTPSYTDNGNGTITDNITGLIWQKETKKEFWDDANTYCSGNTAGLPGTGWRLPSVKDLTSIVDYGRRNPAINYVFTDTSSDYCWSSTTHQSYTSDAWAVDFYNGGVDRHDKNNPYYVRCVRGGGQ